MSNRQAFLDMIAWSEIGPKLLAIPETDNGYKVIVGSTPARPILFDDYSDHPRRLIEVNFGGKVIPSTAAGRYQLLGRYFDFYKKRLGLFDFSPRSQDAIAIQQIKERKALDDIDAGRITTAIAKVSNIWASLPGNTYGQPTQKLAYLTNAYQKAGGTLV